ncbi:hypothetical protein DFH27DRAFT_518763 [Peziza echinospora]|nr:hypothetical protein DFH27DRAFT_518763 [Peziza echinospora]
MPIPLAETILNNGLDSVPFIYPVLRVLPWALLVYVLKWFFAGTKNGNERVMHGRVVMVTGGTSGIGEAIVHDLALRGAQIILLVRSTADAFIIDRINDIRESTNNHLIYAEECDLSSLHSIRLFATKWIDNSPPRRLDMVVLCAGVMAPPLSRKRETLDGVEEHWGINYLANFQLLNILAPALRVQPPDRDVRVLVATCTSYMLGELDLTDTQFIRRGYPAIKPWAAYGASKLALMVFVQEFQRRLNSYSRPDKSENNARCFLIDPGNVRTPGTRRFLSLGSLWGLLVYLIMWPFWWLFLKSPDAAMQTFLAGAMSPECATGGGGDMLKECRSTKFGRPEILDPEYAKALWETTEAEIKDLEKKGAIERNKNKAKTDQEEEAKKKNKARFEEIVEEDEVEKPSTKQKPSSSSTTPVVASSASASSTQAQNPQSQAKKTAASKTRKA